MFGASKHTLESKHVLGCTCEKYGYNTYAVQTSAAVLNFFLYSEVIRFAQMNCPVYSSCIIKQLHFDWLSITVPIMSADRLSTTPLDHTVWRLFLPRSNLSGWSITPFPPKRTRLGKYKTQWSSLIDLKPDCCTPCLLWWSWLPYIKAGQKCWPWGGDIDARQAARTCCNYINIRCRCDSLKGFWYLL